MRHTNLFLKLALVIMMTIMMTVTVNADGDTSVTADTPAETTVTDSSSVEDTSSKEVDTDTKKKEEKTVETKKDSKETIKKEEVKEEKKQDTNDVSVDKKDNSGKLVSENKDYRVTITYSNKANIPEQARLVFKEVKVNSDDYKSYMKKSIKELELSDEEAEIYDGRFFEVNIEVSGKTIKPDQDVTVKIENKNTVNIANEKKIKILSINDKDTKVIKDDITVKAKKNVLKSVTVKTGVGIIGELYTVDYIYDGYNYKIETGHSVKLSKILKELGIKDKDILNVEVSDKDCLEVKKSGVLSVGNDWELKGLTGVKKADVTVKLKSMASYIIAVKVIPECKKISFKDTTGGIQVNVEAPEGALPEGTEMTVKPVSDSKIKKTINKTVDGKVKKISAVDISFTYDGKKIEPEKEIEVTMTDTQSSETDNIMTVVHINDEGKAGTVDAKQSNNEFTFSSTDPSIYAVVETTTISTPFVAGDGRTYEVTVTYTSDAQIPENSGLEVNELSEGSAEYKQYTADSAKAVGSTLDSVAYIKLLDISILKDGQKIQPKVPVDVQIRLMDMDALGSKTQVVHFGDDKTTVVQSNLKGDTVSFETDGFSYYSVISYGETTNLDGRSFAIVQVNTSTNNTETNNKIYEGRALTSTAQNQSTRLSGSSVKVEDHENGKNVVTTGLIEVESWTFEAASEANSYYIKNSAGMYLNVNNNGVSLSTNKMPLTVTSSSSGKVQISNGNYRLASSTSADTITANSNQTFRSYNRTDVNYTNLTLCEIEEFDPNEYPAYEGEKISVQDLKDDQEYIIYKTIFNEATQKYEDWVIDGLGNPVRAYDQGDSISLHSENSPMWKLKILTNNGQPTGYYLFINEATGQVLHPLADGTLVKEYEEATSPTTDGVSLKGRQAKDYTSTIEYWDGSAMAYYGYQFDSTTEGVTLKSETGNNSQEISFAEQKTEQTGLHEVSTVDSASKGITIHMFNYPDRNTISNVTGSNGYGVGVIPNQHVQGKLENGYPKFTNNNSGSTLFDPANSYHKGTGNHLFLDSIYESTGYYEYSAFNNFAYYDQSTQEFKVYEETGTPNPEGNEFYYHRGNFFPYNELDTSETSNKAKNVFTGNGTLIDYENPSYGSTLYGLKGNNVDFYFGMTMDFNFMMPKDGIDKGNPLIYEFNGDDDLWIYVDDVLLLDIGGVHDAFPGSINFETGEITGGNGGVSGARTIKQCFKNAGVFPDGTAWDDSKVDQYFRGNTFVSYGSHKFNMFYMEHGAGASNLKMRFNLPVIEKGNVVVEKQLDNTSQVNYANVKFAYQAFLKDDNGEDIPLTEAVYEGKTGEDGKPVSVPFYNNVKINNEKEYDNVFYLKPTEAAVFSNLNEDQSYYVQEIGIDPAYYDKVYVNDVQIVGEQVIIAEGIYKSTEATVRNRARVTFKNHCDEDNSNELQITKRLLPGSVDNGDTFEFRVMLENASGELVPYYQGTYYIRDDNGVYYRYERGELVSNGETPYACTAGNYGTIAQIPPNYTVVIKDLVAGTDFYVDEIRVKPNNETSDVLLGDSDWELVNTEVKDQGDSEIDNASIYNYATGKTENSRSSMGSIMLENDAKVIFTNQQKAADVQLEKVDEDGNKLSGSTFKLKKLNNDQWQEVSEDLNAISPGETNPIDLGSLMLGRYKLTESTAPDGYITLENDIYFEVYKDTDKSIKVRLTDEAGNASDSKDPAKVTSSTQGTGENQKTVYLITVKNKLGESLPFTGGLGTLFYTLSGMTIMFITALMYIFKIRRGERRLN